MTRRRIYLALCGVIVVFGFIAWQLSIEMLEDDMSEIQVLQKIQKNLKVNAPIQKTPNWLDWATDENTKVAVAGSDISLGSSSTDYQGKVTDRAIEQIDRPFLEEVSMKVREAFFAQGFQESVMNTKRAGTETTTIIDAFERATLKCIASYYAYTDGSITIFCGTIDDTQTQWQHEVRLAILPIDTSSTLNVTKMTADAASGNVYTNPGGYLWLAVKEKGKWRKIFDGQDWPICTLIDRYQISQDVYKNCYDEQKQSLRFAENY